MFSLHSTNTTGHESVTLVSASASRGLAADVVTRTQQTIVTTSLAKALESLGGTSVTHSWLDATEIDNFCPDLH